MTKAEVITDDGRILFMEFNTENDDNVAELAESGGGNMYYECNECHKFFSKYTQLKRHISCHKVADPHNRGYQCSYCERWCATKSSLIRHERIHTGLYYPKSLSNLQIGTISKYFDSYQTKKFLFFTSRRKAF